MTLFLEQLRDASVLSTIDCRFAERIGRLAGEARPEVLLAVALTSRETAAGHTCLDLASLAPLDLVDALAGVDALPSGDRLREVLADSPLVTSPEQLMDSSACALIQAHPLVLDAAGRLYLRRYWVYQNELAKAVRSRAASGPAEFDEALLVDGLDRFFVRSNVKTPSAALSVEQTSFDFESTPSVREPDRQRLAAALSIVRRFSVISGGPGTGKTATASKILALIVEQGLAADCAAVPRIALVAPTGKAASALSGSISSAIETLTCRDEVKAAIPRTALTIHRCLGVRGGALPEFRHGPDHQLAIDALLVDEASMVDLALMTRLLESVPAEARVVFLGDEHQLASVEAGAVLGDICKTAEPAGYSAGFASELERITGAPVERAEIDGHNPVRDSIVRLTHSYRYDPERGIGALARAINRGDVVSALEILDGADHPEVSRFDFEARGEALVQLDREIVDGFAGFLEERDADRMLARFSAFRVLSPLRQGRGGVEELNRQIEAVLRREGLIQSASASYASRPLLVKANDYAQELFNGDIGFVLPGDAGVAFPGDHGKARVFSLPRLPEHETAFAMTIHKSQGSEFDHVAIVITDAAARRATRQLLYTAVTRARKGVTLYASRNAIAQAVERETLRSSGLGDALRSPL